MWDKNNYPEVACSLVALILLENDLPLSNENFEKIFKTTNVKVQKFWYSWFFSKVVEEKVNSSSKIENVPENSQKEQVEKKETQKITEKEESDGDMGFGLFD